MRVKKKGRPGMVVYFDLLPAIKRLSMEQRGELFTALLSYGATGEVTELDQMTGLIFDFIRPKIDRDAERYEESCVQRRYAVYCREAKKDGANPLSYEQWAISDGIGSISDGIGSISDGIGSYPTKLNQKETKIKTETQTEEKKGGPGEKERESALFHQLTKEQQIEFLRSG